MRKLLAMAMAIAAGSLSNGVSQAAPLACAGRPVIDVHLHVYDTDQRLAAGVPNPVTGAPMAARDGAAHRRRLIETLARSHVVRGLVSNPPLSADDAAVAESGGVLRLGYDISDIPTDADLATIRRLHAEGRLASIGEVSIAYAGIRFDDPRMEPLWSLAEELDLPVMLHTGSGPPDAYRGNPRNRIRAGDVLAMEDVIVRHPKLRVVLQHMGYPMGDDTTAMLNSYSQVYVDTGAIDWLVAPAAFRAYLRRFVDAGYGKRILFGSDAMTWPDGVPLAIAGIESADFLTERQKRDILYGNARRFFGWTDLPDC